MGDSSKLLRRVIRSAKSTEQMSVLKCLVSTRATTKAGISSQRNEEIGWGIGNQQENPLYD